MSFAEQEVLTAVYDLAGGRAVLIPYDKVAARLGTTITAVKTISILLQSHKLAIVTFGGVQLTSAGLEQANNDSAVYSD
jgi:hypothetical protein